MILAFAEGSGTPDQTFRALTTNEVEKWWTIPGVYHLKDWKADLHVQGRWSVTVELNNGKQLHEWEEFCELDVPNKIVMTRRFGGNPLLGERETTLTYRLEPSPHGTLVPVREEGFIGRSETKAAFDQGIPLPRELTRRSDELARRRRERRGRVFDTGHRRTLRKEALLKMGALPPTPRGLTPWGQSG